MPRILVLGGGFAGLWSAAAAMRCLSDAGRASVEVALVNRDPWHAIRVRNYEPDLNGIRVPLDDVLGRIGVQRIQAEVTAIDPAGGRVICEAGGASFTESYDRLVIALGSQLVRPNLPGLAERSFDVDTFDGAARLHAHMDGLRRMPMHAGNATAVVAGAGFTGIEVAAELPGRLRSAFAGIPGAPPPRVVLVDRGGQPGGVLSPEARAVMLSALSELGVELIEGVAVAAVDASGVTLSDGRRIDAATVVWCGGMRATVPVASLDAPHDALGRLHVDATLRVPALSGVFAAGDSACLRVDDAHDSVMSCQHARPMGRYAGHNAAADLLGQPLLPLRIEQYVTIMDLGPWGAMYTEGWERKLVAAGEAAKRTKETINRIRIYPPPGGDRQAILDAAAPLVQAAPSRS